MKTTFSLFPGMFENPAPEKYYLTKTKAKILWNTSRKAWRCPWKKFRIMKKKFRFLACNTHWPHISVHKKFQPNRSSHLASYTQYISYRYQLHTNALKNNQWSFLYKKLVFWYATIFIESRYLKSFQLL